MNPHLQRALLLLGQDRFELAEDELRQALGEMPDDPQVHAVLAICLAQREQFTPALAAAQQAIELGPDQAFSFFAMSVVQGDRNDVNAAVKAVQTAIEMEPFDTRYWTQLAQLRMQQRRWKDALEAAEKGLELDPEHVPCTNLRALALTRLGHQGQATEAIETALKRNPEDAYSHANMGWSLISQGKYDQALTHFGEALRLNPELDWARAGIVEAMKARFWIYRIVLGWFLWMMKLQSQAQWGVIIGGYVAYRILTQLARSNPALAPWLMPLIVLYIAFALLTWVASPLFNLMLRLSRHGRLALSREDIKTSNWVGVCALGALALLGVYLATGDMSWTLGALACALLIPPVSHIYHCDEGWPRATLVLVTLGLAELSLVMISLIVVAQFLPQHKSEVVAGIAGFFFLPFVIGAVAMQFIVHALVAAKPRKGTKTARSVWIYGTIALSVGTVLIFTLIGLVLWADAVSPADRPPPADELVRHVTVPS